jgi:esterase
MMDLTGHGTSPALPPGAGLFELGQDVLGTADALGLPRPLTIVGHSLGGRVGLAAALVAPGAVGEVTLLDIAPGPITGAAIDSSQVVRGLLAMPAHVATRAEVRDALLARGLSPGVVDWLGTNLVPEGDGYAWRFDRAALAELHPRVNAGDLWGAVERHAAVVREIRGARSLYVTDEDVRRLEAAGCEVVTLEGSGHFVHVEAPDALLEALLRFHGSE